MLLRNFLSGAWTHRLEVLSRAWTCLGGVIVAEDSSAVRGRTLEKFSAVHPGIAEDSLSKQYKISEFSMQTLDVEYTSINAYSKNI